MIGIGIGLSKIRGVRLGPELVLNSGMEAATNWTDAGGTPALTNPSDPRPGSTGSKSLDVAIAAAQASGIIGQDVTLEVGKRYRLSGWAKNVNATDQYIYVYSGAWGTLVNVDLPSTVWTHFGADFTATDTIARFYLTTAGSAAQHGRWDDISLRKIL